MHNRRIISYTNLDGEQVQVEYYFALSTTDIIKIDAIAEHQEQFSEWLQELIQNNRFRELVNIWEQMIFTGVARREGQRLIKGKEIVDEFVGTGAFDALFDELLDSGPDKITDFFTSMMPEKLLQKAAEAEAAAKAAGTDELLTMSDEDFFRAAGTKNVMDMDPKFLAIAMKRKTLGQAA